MIHSLHCPNQVSFQKMDKTQLFLLVQLLIFNIVMPTVDLVSDTYLCVKLLLAGHPLWAAAVAMPMVINALFTAAAWHRCPHPSWSHRSLDWATLLLQVIKTLGNELYLCLGVAPVLGLQHHAGPSIGAAGVDGEKNILQEERVNS